MILTKLIGEVNTLIDDSLPPAQITGWVNDALAQIGAEVGAVFPEASLTNDIELPIPNKWQRLLLVTFAAARAKQQDSSQFEYNDLYSQFSTNLGEFQVQYEVPVKYKELKAGLIVTLPDDSTVETETGDTIEQIALDNSTTASAIFDVEDNDDVLKFVGDSHHDSDAFEKATFTWWGGEW